MRHKQDRKELECDPVWNLVAVSRVRPCATDRKEVEFLVWHLLELLVAQIHENLKNDASVCLIKYEEKIKIVLLLNECRKILKMRMYAMWHVQYYNRRDSIDAMSTTGGSFE